MSKKIKFLLGEQSSLENASKIDGALYFAKYKLNNNLTDSSENTFINLYYSDGKDKFLINPMIDYEGLPEGTYPQADFTFWPSIEREV